MNSRHSLVALIIAFAAMPSAAVGDMQPGDAQAGKSKAQVCAACHGAEGISANPEWPNLAGQHARYTNKQLADFKAGKERNNAIMAQQVANLSPQDMADLGAYFATLTPAGGYVSEARLALGERIYRGGNQDSGVAACQACHGPTGAGDPMAAIPMLSGQQTTYAINQLMAFRDGSRANDPQGMMRGVARRMSDEEIRAVSEYIAGLH
jgi:cytochrome c553